MDTTELEQAILGVVMRPGYQPVKPRVIAKKLKIPKDQAKEVKRAIKRLVRRGQLTYLANHLITRPSPENVKGNRVRGVFQRTAAGYGFVRPLGASPEEARQQEIYIPAKGAGDASSGDVVLVHLAKARGRKYPGPRGAIVEVLERQTHQFVGTYFEVGDAGYVEVDGTLFSQPIYVGDPGAKSARPDDKVVFEMVRFPSHLHDGEGVITEVLGPRGKPGVDTLSIIREFALPDEFPEEVLEESRQQAEAFDESIPDGRRDLTALTVITIDPADARDFDDAISLERTGDGAWRLGVHIADVSHFVRPGTVLDREARERSTSVYLPDRVIPMLPEIISNHLASLQPAKVRYVKSAFLEFTPEGIRTSTDFHSAAIKSDKRLTYEQVDEFLADRKTTRRKLGDDVWELLGRMHELAMILRRRRFEHGALEMSMPEVKVELDEEGRVAGARVEEHTESHQIIEEFMLAANEAVAEALAGAELDFLRRVHKSPTERKMQDLTQFVRELGIAVESLQSRFELQKLLDQVVGRPEQHAVHYAVLRSLQRAIYSPEEVGHYALASDCYCHFTSPIRRYPDLTVHRLLEAVLAGDRPYNDYAELMVLGEHCSERERRAEAAERELTKVKLLEYLSERIGEEMEAVVTGVERFGLFVQGVDLPAEGLIHVEALADDYYRFDRESHTLSGHRSGNVFRLGDLLRVAVARVDVQRRELDFRLVRRLERESIGTPRQSDGKKKSKKRGAASGKSRTAKKAKRGKRPSRGRRN